MQQLHNHPEGLTIGVSRGERWGHRPPGFNKESLSVLFNVIREPIKGFGKLLDVFAPWKTTKNCPHPWKIPAEA